MNLNLLAFGMPGPMEMAVIGIVAVLLFGSRLPSIAKSVGQSLMSFKKGFREVEAEVEEMERVGHEAAEDFTAKTKEVEQEFKSA